jgi:hypothetical protein
MWRYGKLKGKFSDGEMNDRFTDMGFSQGHQSCGGSPIFQSGKSAKPWAREGALKPWHTWGSNPQRCRHPDCNVQRLDHSATFLLAKMQKKKTRISESRKPEKVETQNGEMISISPLRCRNLEFLLFRLCVFAFTISRFNFVFQNPKAKSNIL